MRRTILPRNIALVFVLALFAVFWATNGSFATGRTYEIYTVTDLKNAAQQSRVAGYEDDTYVLMNDITITAEDQRIIAEAYEAGIKPHKVCTPDSGIYESIFKSVARRYVRHWRERLRAEGISLESLPDLTKDCFSHYSRQFMQIRGTPNKLFVSPT